MVKVGCVNPFGPNRESKKLFFLKSGDRENSWMSFGLDIILACTDAIKKDISDPVCKHSTLLAEATATRKSVLRKKLLSGVERKAPKES